ncbi:hypothetical protein B0H19DRAFT_1074579 [Mycena capillaripes]|nr:hypothetical protein B0H19DRAFT_1074579 [Mycena capillaripes]
MSTESSLFGPHSPQAIKVLRKLELASCLPDFYSPDLRPRSALCMFCGTTFHSWHSTIEWTVDHGSSRRQYNTLGKRNAPHPECAAAPLPSVPCYLSCILEGGEKSEQDTYDVLQALYLNHSKKKTSTSSKDFSAKPTWMKCALSNIGPARVREGDTTRASRASEVVGCRRAPASNLQVSEKYSVAS